MPYKFRSNAEARIAKWLEDNGIKYDYENIKIPYTSTVKNGLCEKCGNKKALQRRTYLPDFTFPDYGWILEVKGRLTSSDRSKMIDIKKANPEISIRLLLLQDNKLRKNSEKRYSTWCLDNGFLYCVKNLPISWFKK